MKVVESWMSYEDAKKRAEILEKLKDPNISDEEKTALSIEIRRQKTIHEKWEEGGITILPPETD